MKNHGRESIVYALFKIDYEKLETNLFLVQINELIII